MSNIAHPPLSRPDAALLTAAAGRPHGRIVLLETFTPLAAKRMIGRLLKRGLIELRAAECADSVAAHALTPAGYASVGMTPPAPPILPPVSTATGGAADPQTPRKRDLILGLLGRAEGASLSELIAATGWLPHTTRAALSRLRSAGRVLDKSTRGDGSTAYRIVAPQPAPRRRSARSNAGLASVPTQATAV